MKRIRATQTIGTASADWLAELRALGRSPRTVATYQCALENLSRFLTRRCRVDPKDVTTRDIEAWRLFLVRDSCQPATVNQFLRTVRGYFQWLSSTGRIFADPTKDVVLPKSPVRLGRCPTEAEMKRLLDGIRGRDPIGRRDRALCELAYASGARLDEMVRLDCGAVDLSGGLVRLLGKGRRDRVVPLTTTAVRALSVYLDRARPRLICHGATETALFLSSRTGERLASAAIAAVVRSRGRKAGMALTPHAIRRAFASHLLRAGAPLVQIKELLGHQSFSHLHHYLRLHPGDLISTARRSRPGKR